MVRVVKNDFDVCAIEVGPPDLVRDRVVKAGGACPIHLAAGQVQTESASETVKCVDEKADYLGAVQSTPSYARTIRRRTHIGRAQRTLERVVWAPVELSAGNVKGESLNVGSVQDSSRSIRRKRMLWDRHRRSRADGLRTGPIQPHAMDSVEEIGPVDPAATRVHDKIRRASRSHRRQ